MSGGLTIGTLTGLLRTDDSGMRRGLSDADLRMRGFQRDVEGRIRHIDGRFATMGEQIAAGLRTGSDEGRRFGFSLGRIASMAGGLGGVAMSIGRMAAMLGAAVPLAAGLAATVANIAPAAGLAATGLIAMQLATKAFELGMVGVGDAVKAAMDPSNPEAFNEALKKLSPSAQAFAKQVRSLQPEFKKLQQDVQERMFQGLDKVLKGMSTHTLPVLRKGLVDAGGALNLMAKGVGNAAIDLAKEGTLGKAIKGATAGLTNLSRVPGQLTTGLTQVAAAAAPAFARLTKSAGSAFDRMSERFSKAFESGAMEKAIEQAITLIGDLAEVAGNVFQIIGSIFKAAQASGGGFIGTLQEITNALVEAFASKEVQAGLKAIFQTMSVLAKTAAPLLIDALKVIAPIFAALGPPIQVLIKALGNALQPIIKALGPILLSAAKAVGALVEAAAPLLPVIGELVASLLPAVTPLLDTLVVVFEACAPIVKQVAEILQATLAPIIAGLVPIVGILAKMIGDQLVLFLGLLGDILIEIGPSLVKLGESCGELLIALAPLIQTIAELGTQLLIELMPIIEPLIELIGELAAIFADELAAIIKTVVVPALQLVVALLRGDFSGAWDAAKRLVGGIVATLIRWFWELPQKVWSALSTFGTKLKARMVEAGDKMKRAAAEKLSDLVARVRELPGRARDALGDLGSKLWDAGWRLIGGFIDGISARIPSVRDVLGELTSSLTSWKGPESLDKRLLTPAGQMLIQGFQRGISSQIPALRGQLQGLTGELPGMSVGMAGGSSGARGITTVRIELSGPEEVKRLIRKIVQVDGRGSVQTAFGK